MTGAGPWTSVSLPYVSGRPGDAWGAEAAEHGGVGTQRVLGVEEVAASPDVAGMLGVDPGDAVVVRRRLMLLDGRPVELVESHYPAAIARGTRLADVRKIPGGAVALLAGLGYPPRRVREDVSARQATPEEQAELQLDPLSLVLRLERTLFTEGDVPVEAGVMTMVADHRRLRYELML